MRRFGWILTLALLTCGPWHVRGADAPTIPAAASPRPAVIDWGPPVSPALAAVLARDPFAAGETNSVETEKTAGPPGAQHTRDNAFLVEEAYNQEPGVVQHIFNWINTWDRVPGLRSRDFVMTYTMEIPIGSQTHQFSFTTLFLTQFEKPAGGPATQQGDIGDTFLNYRYQLLADDDFLWCAPRATLILPTGDERFGSGTGQVGYQVNLPISRYGETFDNHFNLGYTIVPGVSVPIPNGSGDPEGTRPSPRHDLRAVNLGGSTYWKPRTDVHLFVEVFALWFDEINDLGGRDRTTQVFINPGFRYVACQFDDVEWVLGASVPVGLTRDTPDIGVFAYMSIEHTVRKRNGGQ